MQHAKQKHRKNSELVVEPTPPKNMLLKLDHSPRKSGWRRKKKWKPLHPGKPTAGTYSHHLWKEGKMIWTKPSWLWGTQPLIFRAVEHLRFRWSQVNRINCWVEKSPRKVLIHLHQDLPHQAPWSVFQDIFHHFGAFAQRQGVVLGQKTSRRYATDSWKNGNFQEFFVDLFFSHSSFNKITPLETPPKNKYSKTLDAEVSKLCIQK